MMHASALLTSALRNRIRAMEADNAALRCQLAAQTEQGEYWHAQAIANAVAAATANTSLAAAQSRTARGADHMPDSPWRREDE